MYRQSRVKEGEGMQLKPRLAALAELIPPGSVVADIGTDHAYLPLYLAGHELAPRVIAVENRSTTFEQARRSLDRYKETQRIELRYGDGLKPIKRVDGVGVVVMAGMGGRTICRLLLASREKWSWFKTFIFQPAQKAALLRRWLIGHNFRISRERLVKEGRCIYEIIVAERGAQHIINPLLYELGPCLVEAGDPHLKSFIEKKIKSCHAILHGLKASPEKRNSLKRRYYEEKKVKLQEVLELVSKS